MNSSTEAENDVKEFGLSKASQILQWFAVVGIIVAILVAWPEKNYTPRGAMFNSILQLFSLIFAVFVAISVLFMQSNHPGTVLTISPTGIRDARWSDVEIPWSAIRSITNEKHPIMYRGMRYFNIEVDELRFPKNQNGLSRATPGYQCYSLMLDVTNLEDFDFEKMFELCEQHLARVRGTQAQGNGTGERPTR